MVDDEREDGRSSSAVALLADDIPQRISTPSRRSILEQHMGVTPRRLNGSDSRSELSHQRLQLFHTDNRKANRDDLDDFEDGDGDGEDFDHLSQELSEEKTKGLTSTGATGPSTQPDKLNDETLGAIRSYLQHDAMREILDEDSIVRKMVQTDQIASDRVRYRQDPFEDSDDENVARMSQPFKEEEEYALAQAFFREVITKGLTSQTHDKRTVNYLRKAMGLHRRNELWETTGRHHQHVLSNENSDNSDGSDHEKARRLTRGMARSTRIKRREERVYKENLELDALLAAVKELEPPPVPAAVVRKDTPKPSGTADVRGGDKKLGQDHAARENIDQKPRQSQNRGYLENGGARKPIATTMGKSYLKLPPKHPRKLSQKRAMKHIMDPRSLGDSTETDEEENSHLVARVSSDWNRSKKPRLATSQVDVKVTKILAGGKSIVRSKNLKTKFQKPPTSRIHNSPNRSKNGADTSWNGARSPKRSKADALLMKPKRPRLYTPETESDAFGTPLIAPKKRKRKKKLENISPPVTNDKNEKPVKFPEAPATPISLSLLEWKRRHQWIPSKEDKTESTEEEKKDEEDNRIKMPPNLATSGIETKLPSWDTVNPFKDMTRQPPMNDPPRQRHSDRIYAGWCSRLISCLSGSGRSWARHEFFYSDLDRPWFTFNQFAVDMAQRGVPPNARLSRSEWSLLRRQIRGRPRRFSRAFVESQMKELNFYRQTVRSVQQWGKGRPPGFTFQIPAAIKVGTTVTAFNRKYRVLHRGVVLAYDIVRSMYLVQFERKELGFEFSPDTEVASHGVPDLLGRSTEATLDGTNIGGFSDLNAVPGSIVYGTCYRPFVNEWQSRDSARSGQQDNRSVVETCKAAPRDDVTEEEIVEKVAEREVVIKLIEVIDSAMKRKTRLMESLRGLNASVRRSSKDMLDVPIEEQCSESFRNHYAWLLANLRVTSLSLESALVYLQMMYGERYMRSQHRSTSEEESAPTEFASRIVKHLVSSGSVNAGVYLEWVSALVSLSSMLSSRIRAPKDEDDTSPSMGQLRRRFLDGRIAHAGRLLMSMGYFTDFGQNLADQPDASLGAARSALQALESQLKPPAISKWSDHVSTEASTESAKAMSELQDALLCFSSELTAQHANNKDTLTE